MGKGNKGRKHKASSQGASGEGKPRAINPTWSDCTPAFRLEAEGVLRLRDEFLQAQVDARRGEFLQADDDALRLREQIKDRLRRRGEDLARKYPKSPLAHHLAGQSKVALGKPGQALTYLTQASALQPNCLGIAYSVAAAHAELEHFGLAADECKRALAVEDPTDPRLHTVVGEPPPPPGPDHIDEVANVRVAIAKERLRGLLADVKALPCSIDMCRQRWKGMDEDHRRSFLKIGIDDMLAYFRANQQGFEQQHTVEAGLEFVKATQAWVYWACPCCKDIYLDAEMFWLHIQEKHVDGLTEYLVNLPQQPDKEAEFSVICDDSKQVTLGQGHITLLFDDDKLLSNEDDESFASLLTFLRRPMGETSWTRLWQGCLTKGAYVIAETQKMMHSLKKFSLPDSDDLDNKASPDVASGMNQLKTNLVQACRLDYHSVIFPAMQIYLTAKLNDMAVTYSEDNANKQHSLDKQPKQDKVPAVPEKVEMHGQTSRPLRKKIKDKRLADEFGKFLKEYKRTQTEEPFYVGELKAMISRKGKTFCVYYNDITRHDESLSYSLRQVYGRIHHLLQDAVTNFIIEKKMVEECKKVSPSAPKLVIYGLPLPSSEQTLADFLRVERHKLTEKVEIYGNLTEVAVVTTQLGRDLFIGFLRCMLKTHREGKSWNGDLCADDLRVKDGIIFEIAKTATVKANQQSMATDIKQLAALLMGHYRNSGCLPAYFTQLESDMSKCLDSLGSYDSDKTKKFHKYLEAHLALKSAMARGHLFLDLYRVRQALTWDDFSKLHYILTSKNLEWIAKAEKNQVLKDVGRKGLDKSDTRAKNTTEDKSAKESEDDTRKPYFNDPEHLLLFIRHVAQHGGDHSKDKDEDQQQRFKEKKIKKAQKFKNLTGTDLIIGKYLARYVTELIQILWKNYNMEGDIFGHAWKHFSDSR